ncbi:MAG: U32 family peptidase [Acidobacteria bacterium]|nr:U32 family peptidase [Acidobacteriota bacterium]
MKVLAPIRSLDELEMLHTAGAQELYCGLAPREWVDENPGPLWLHRRSPKGSSVESWADMRELADAARLRGLPLFATLNAPSYGPTQAPQVLRFAQRLSEECGVDALIIADVNLLAQAASLRLNARLHVSSVAATLNTEAIRFLAGLGASRVILPRSVTLAEIEHITGQTKDLVEIEVFALNDGCAFEEGFCSTTHHHSVGAFCTSLSGMKADFAWSGKYFSSRRERWLRANLEDYRAWVWYLTGNGCSATAKGLPYGPCALCALHDLARFGVASLKVVGRESSPFRKLASVRMVRHIADQVHARTARPVIIGNARALRQEPEHCDAGYMCYYQTAP